MIPWRSVATEPMANHSARSVSVTNDVVCDGAMAVKRSRRAPPLISGREPNTGMPMINAMSLVN